MPLGMATRQISIMAATIIVAATYSWSILAADTLPKAADRLGKAVLTGDTDTIWSFVPSDEQSFYDLDKEKFSIYWKTIVAPKLVGFSDYEFRAAGSNGIEVVAKSGSNAPSEKRFTMLVSGQKGHYYVPYIVGVSAIHSAAIDFSNRNITKLQRCDHYAKWVKDNKNTLEQLGFAKIRRGPIFPSETLSELIQYFEKGAKEERERVQLVTR